MNEPVMVVKVVANFFVQKCIIQLLDIDLRLTEPALKTVQGPNVVGLMTGSKSIRTTNTYWTVPVAAGDVSNGRTQKKYEKS